jgi:hypothetical protein
MLGENRARRSVVGADVLEYRRVSRLLGMMIDDQIDPVDEAAEIVRLHVHHRNPVELLQRGLRDLLDGDVEQVRHPEVFRPRHPLDRADDGGRLGAAQHVSQRQAAGHRVRIGIVVEQEELRHREVRDVGKLRMKVFDALGRRIGADPEHVHEDAARVAHGIEDLLEAAFAIVLDDDAGAGAEIGFDEGVGAPRIAYGDGDAGVMQAPGERLALDDEFDLEAGQQDFVEHPDDQFVLTDGETPHRVPNR